MISIKTFFTAFAASICLFASAQNLKQPVISQGNLSKTTPQAPHNHAAHSCGHEDMAALMMQSNPNYLQELQQHQRGVEQVSREQASAMRQPQAVIEIPVVVHVIHQGEAVGTGRNISDARIIAQLNVLNTDFRKQNTNWASGTPAVFQAAGADVEIHFCLAKTTPTGATTTGINRQQKTVTGTSTANSNIETATTGVKALYKWDPTRYLNIYVLPIPGTSALGGVIGYSYLPTGGVVGTYQDGIVLDYRWFGQTGQAGLSGGGRSLTHEVGHYLGLPHIWANASNTGGCAADDGIADTPEQNDATANNAAFNCASGVPPVSCGTQNMYVDYMDYLDDDACYTQFTAGQKAVMRSILTGSGATFGLTNRTALVNNGLTQCSACTMTAATSGITSITCVSPGTATATATNVPTGNTATYAWSNGATTASISTTTGGTYTVTITANSSCMATATAVILNTCTSLCDTLSNYNLGVDSARIYSAASATSSGFVSGNNSYGDLAKADYFDYSAGAHTHIKGFYIAFGYAKDAAPSTNINLRVWSANGTAGAPNTVLGTIAASLTTIKNDVAAGNYIHYYEFPNPLALPANKKFYIGVDLPTTTGDTLVVITNQTSAMAAGTGTAWEKGSNGTWHNYSDATLGWGVDLAHLISPVLGTATVAAFTPATTSAACNTPVTFNSSTSVNASIRTWNFTGGTPATSTAVSPSITYAAAGTYTVQLITQNACLADTITGTVTITCASCTLAATSTATATTCNLANGGASVAATGGTPPYTYIWSNGGTAASISNVAAGTYTVTITAGVGCTLSKTAVVAASTAITATTTPTNTSCGLANGGASVTATGGTAPYTYIWSNAATTASISNIAAGTYTVTVTGSAGCTKTATVVVTASTALTATTTSGATTCGLANGTANITAGGGTTYTYAWNNAATTASISNLAAGTYTVTVTGGVGCTRTATAVVAASTGVTAATTPTPTTCGLANGAANATATGGTTYTYVWSNAATTASISNIAAGTYTVTVTANTGCTRTATAVIPASTGVMVTTFPTNTSCGLSNGSADASVTGGTTYTYTWNNGATTVAITNLAAGTYIVTVTANTGCTKTATAVIAPSTALNATIASTATTCGLANGTANVTATGGTNYTYTWNNNATTASIANLAAGTYTVTVSAGAGCSRSVSVVIASSTGLVAGITSSGTTCGQANGSLTASAGGTAYIWSNNATTQTINGLAAGTYTVTISSSAGCTASTSGVIVPSLALNTTVSATQTIAGQSTGTTTVTATNNAPFTYAWSNGGTTQTISNLPAGVYTVTVTNAANCTRTASVTVTEIVGTNDIKGLQNLLLYPNPTNSELYIAIDFDQTTNLDWTLTNAIGQVLASKNVVVQRHYLETIDMRDNSAGIYFITLKTENGQTTRKVLVVK